VCVYIHTTDIIAYIYGCIHTQTHTNTHAHTHACMHTDTVVALRVVNKVELSAALHLDAFQPGAKPLNITKRGRQTEERRRRIQEEALPVLAALQADRVDLVEDHVPGLGFWV
jgi:hypothetical protein